MFKKSAYFALAGILLLISCSRFQDGPYFTVLTVKQRISREWRVEYALNLATGISHSADFDGWKLSVNKDGTYSYTVIYNQEETNYSGEWEIIGQNQLRFEYLTNFGKTIEFYTLLRLTKNELWLRDQYEEIHYYAD